MFRGGANTLHCISAAAGTSLSQTHNLKIPSVLPVVRIAFTPRQLPFKLTAHINVKKSARSNSFRTVHRQLYPLLYTDTDCSRRRTNCRRVIFNAFPRQHFLSVSSIIYATHSGLSRCTDCLVVYFRSSKLLTNSRGRRYSQSCVHLFFFKNS